MITTLEISTVPGVKRLHTLALVTAAVAGLFCVFFTAIILYQYHVAWLPIQDTVIQDAMPGTVPIVSSDPTYRQPAADSFNLLPTDRREFLNLKRRLAADKQNEELKGQIRDLDQKLRFDFFQRREIIAKTAPLLLVSVVIFLIAGRIAIVLNRRLPVPVGDPVAQARREEAKRLRLGLTTLVGFSMLLVGLAVGLLVVPTPSFEKVLLAKLQNEPKIPVAAENKPLDTAPLPMEPPLDRAAFLAELSQNWPSFRGFDGSGVAGSRQPPVRWDATTGENIAWKTEVPLPGKSSPIIWGNRLFLSGADETKRQVFCFDAENGKLIWTADAPSTPESAKPFEVSEDTGRAAPTMVADGRRAFALFANGDLVAVDFEGRILWSKSLGIPESAYGFSSSPALYFDRLIVQYDVGDGSDGKSKLFAFDVKTGETVWETPREIPNSWSSPIVRKIADRYQIITCGAPFVVAYDPEDGKELWRCKCLGGDVGPSATAWENVVYITNQMPRTTAIDAAAALAAGGDVTSSAVLWQGTNALPDTPSPFATKDRLFTMDSHGYLTAYDPANIKNKRALYWELEIGGGEAAFYSSPLLVDRLVYLFDMSEEAPKAFVVDLSKAATDESGSLTEAAAAAMIVGTNPMSEPCVSSPAVLNDRLFIRGTKTIFCIKKP